MFGDPVNFDLPHASAMATWLILILVVLTSLYGLLILSRISGVQAKYVIFVWCTYLAISILSGFYFGDLGIPSDGQGYDRQAATLADSWGFLAANGPQSELTPGKEGFPTLMAILYSIGGRVPFSVIFINCAIVAATFAIILWSAREGFDHANSKLVMFTFLTWPIFLSMGPTLLREAMCWLGISLVALGLARFRSHRISSVFLIISSWTFVWWIRDTLSLLLLIGIVSGIGVVLLRDRLGTPGLLLAFGTCLASLYFFASPLLELSGNDQARLSTVRNALSDEATSGYTVQTGGLEAVFGDLAFLVANLPNVILGPFPWQLGSSFVMIWALFGTLFWWFALWSLFRLHQMRKFESLTLVYLIVSVVILIGLSASLTNYGIVVRLRALPMILMLVIMAGKVPEYGTLGFRLRIGDSKTRKSPAKPSIQSFIHGA